MESIVEDVEDEREKEGNPANSKCFIDGGGTEGVRISICVNHSDGLSRHGHCYYQGRHCQAENNCSINLSFYKTENTTRY